MKADVACRHIDRLLSSAIRASTRNLRGARDWHASAAIDQIEEDIAMNR